jgi:hypothetical protein
MNWENSLPPCQGGGVNWENSLPPWQGGGN